MEATLKAVTAIHDLFILTLLPFFYQIGICNQRPSEGNKISDIVSHNFLDFCNISPQRHRNRWDLVFLLSDERSESKKLNPQQG